MTLECHSNRETYHQILCMSRPLVKEKQPNVALVAHPRNNDKSYAVESAASGVIAR